MIVQKSSVLNAGSEARERTYIRLHGCPLALDQELALVGISRACTSASCPIYLIHKRISQAKRIEETFDFSFYPGRRLAELEMYLLMSRVSCYSKILRRLFCLFIFHLFFNIVPQIYAIVPFYVVPVHVAPVHVVPVHVVPVYACFFLVSLSYVLCPILLMLFLHVFLSSHHIAL